MFSSSNFIVVMAGLNLFDNDAILKEYEFLSPNIKNDAEITINSVTLEEKFRQYLNHKEIIKVIREIK
jgi:hypothetical protein